MNKSDGIYKNVARDGVARAETGTLDNWSDVLGLEASMKLKMVEYPKVFRWGQRLLCWGFVPRIYCMALGRGTT